MIALYLLILYEENLYYDTVQEILEELKPKFGHMLPLLNDLGTLIGHWPKETERLKEKGLLAIVLEDQDVYKQEVMLTDSGV